MKSASMPLRLKGLAVVLSLLFIEFAIFGGLLNQIEQAENEARHQAQLKEIASNTEKLGRVLWESRRALNHYLMARDQSSWNAYTRLSEQLPQTINWLKTHADFDSAQSKLLNEIEAKLNKCLNWLAQSKTKVDQMSPSESIEFLNNPENSILMVYQTLINDIIRLGKTTDEQVKGGPQQQQRLRESNRQWIIGGLAINVIVAMVLALLFTRNITDRLKIMVENTNHLRQSKSLHPPVGGGDEISSLDAAFHKMSDELLEAQRVKQAFTAMISHELRTPLSSVRGFLELLSMGALGDVSSRITDQSERVQANVERLIKLINDLLDLEKMEAGKMKMAPEAVSLEAAVQRSLSSVEFLCETYKVKVEISNLNFTVFADENRLEQVLVNLLSNAIKFSPANEIVSVTARKEGQWVEIQVEDGGRGVPDEHKNSIFESYKQIEISDGTTRGGTGLGLPICKLIVEQLGGSIGVKNAAQQGSIFWFRLPAN